MKNKKGFWGKFDELMSSLPDYIEEQTSQVTAGSNNPVFHNSHNNIVISNGKSTSTVVQDGKTIVVKTVNGKTTITVDGKEYVATEADATK